MGDWTESQREGVLCEREYHLTLSAEVWSDGTWHVYYKSGDPWESGTWATVEQARKSADSVAARLY